jgi:acyl-coenzyme A thioesterase PaaI-like protein
MSLASADHNPLAVEFKISLLSPAIGDRFEARARVLRRGKTLTMVQADVFAISSAGEQRIATLLETVILRSGVPSR